MIDDASESLAAARRGDARCDEFELALATGKSPQIEAFLTDIPAAERQALLLELLGLELDFRVAHGEQPQMGDYAKRFPELSAEQLAAIVEVSRGRAGVIASVGSAVPNADQPTILSPTDAVNAANVSAPGTVKRVRYFGDYELLREIARGGMGVVYEARQRSLNRPVALKMILSGQLASTEEVARFRREAEAAAQLEHPGIVPIFEIGTDGNQHYFTMGYVPGASLSARLLERPLEPREAATLIRDVAMAVQYAHERGVVHRDLKPSNILLAPQSDSRHVRQNVGQTEVRPHSGECGYTPRITDFGLAKVSHADHSLTETGQILGTPSYMPPEQASGLTHQIGPAADIYSLGAVLYACLTGRPPFQAASVLDTVRQVLERDPVSLRDLNLAIPQDLETICLKCLEKSIPRRYATAKDVADELQRYLDGHPILARPVSRVERFRRWCRRNPMIASLSAAIALSLLLGIAVSSYFAWKENKRAISESNARNEEGHQRREAVRQTGIAKKLADENFKLAEDEKVAREKADLNAETANQQSQRAQQQTEIANRQTELAQRQSTLTKRHLYVAHMNLAKAAWEASRVAEVTRLLDLYRPVVGQNVENDDPRGFEWYYWDRCCHCDRLTLTAPKPLQSMAFSRDGKWLATASYNTFVVQAQPGEVKLWDAATGLEVRTLKGHTHGVNDVEFSPDGKRLASASADATVKIWDVETGRELVAFNGHSAAVYQMAFSRDGRRLVSASAMSPPQPPGTPDAFQLKLWDASSGQEIRTFDQNSDRTRCLAFSPDDRTLATGGLDGINLLDPVTGKLKRSLEYDNSPAAMGRRWIVSDVAFSPDGKLLASVSMDQTIKLWDVTTGKNTSTIRGQTEGFTSVAFTPDSQRLVSSCFDQTINVWDVATGQEQLCLKGHTDRIIRVAMNTDGTRIASADSSGGVKLWDAATQQTARPLEVTEAVGGMAFRDDGKLLAVTGLAQTINLCDPNTGKVTRTLKIDARRSSVVGQYDAEIEDVAFSPDGTKLAVACGDWTAKVFNVATGAEVLTLDPHTGGVSSVAFSRDQKWLATASANTMSSNTPGEVKVWDAATGALKLDLKGHTNRVQYVAFSPDSKWLASASSDKTVRIWEIATGQQSRSLAGHTGAVNGVAFSPEGNRIASAGGHHDHSIKLWDVGNGTELLSIKGHLSSVNRVVFSRDGQRLASASADGTAKVWDAQTGLEILTFKDDMRFYQCVAFSPDSKRLAAGGIYGSARLGTARIWDGAAENQRTQTQ